MENNLYSIDELKELFFFLYQDRDDLCFGFRRLLNTMENHYILSITRKVKGDLTQEQKNYILNDIVDKAFSILDNKVKYLNYLQSDREFRIGFTINTA